MEIFELAAELGKALKEDDRLKALESARLAYETSAELQSMMSEYETQQQILQTEVGKAEERDMLLVENVDDREFFRDLFEAMYPELPEPTKKGKKR